MALGTNVTALAVVKGAALAGMLAFTARAEDVEDTKFLQDAIQSAIAEVKMSELALQRSSDDGVRDLAHRLQTDHSVSMQEAAALAKDLGTRIPSAPTDDAQQHYVRLAQLSGPEFDAAFVTQTVAAHRDAVARFGAATHGNPNEAIAGFAAKTLPTLEKHLEVGESLLGAGAHPAAHGAAAGHDAGAGHDARGADPQLRVPPAEAPSPR
jgi:putative membrane protein